MESLEAYEIGVGRGHGVVELEVLGPNTHAREAIDERLHEGAHAGQEVDCVGFGRLAETGRVLQPHL